MFTKNHRITIESGFAMDLVRVLGKYGVKFEVTDEYRRDNDTSLTWYRDFIIHATRRKMIMIRKALKHRN